MSGTAVSPFRQPKAVFAVAFACVVSFMGIGHCKISRAPTFLQTTTSLAATPRSGYALGGSGSVLL